MQRGSRHSTRAAREDQDWRIPADLEPSDTGAHEVTLADDYVVLDAVSQLGQANSGSPPRCG